jgi:hypothetical protein
MPLKYDLNKGFPAMTPSTFSEKNEWPRPMPIAVGLSDRSRGDYSINFLIGDGFS